MAAAKKKHLDEFGQFQARLESLNREVDLETQEGREALQEWCRGVVNWLACLTKREIARTVRDRRTAKDERRFFEESMISGVSRVLEDAAKESTVLLPAEAGAETHSGSVISPDGDNGKVTPVAPTAPPVGSRK